MKNFKILFQGDSITDCDRNREEIADLGNGYPKFVAEILKEKYPNYNFTFVNKGISGNRSIDLVHRWQEDCIDIKPDILSVLVGINDTWRRYDENDITTAEDFEKNYRFLLTEVKERLGIPVIILEPYLLEASPDRAEWRADLDPKIHIIRKLAREFGYAYIPLDGLMNAESCNRDMKELSEDGVHPCEMGKQLIANAYVKTIEKFL